MEMIILNVNTNLLGKHLTHYHQYCHDYKLSVHIFWLGLDKETGIRSKRKSKKWKTGVSRMKA